MSSKYKPIKTDTVTTKWNTTVTVNNVRRYPKNGRKK